MKKRSSKKKSGNRRNFRQLVDFHSMLVWIQKKIEKLLWLFVVSPHHDVSGIQKSANDPLNFSDIDDKTNSFPIYKFRFNGYQSFKRNWMFYQIMKPHSHQVFT